MIAGTHEKIAVSHLKRTAYLYVRQSTLRQVVENQESTQRQYALRDRAVALGWPIERVVVIDSDQGKSGAATDRKGFQRLVAEVGMGRAGIVLGLEVSRLARSCTDWHRLLEICALTDTLILDEDGIYDPSHFNDRLLLGLKGTMSEAELHILRARLRGGILSKARRGELKVALPVGLVYTVDDQVVLDPDQQVQQTLNLFFQTFRRMGSAFATVKAFRKQEILFPVRVRTGPHKGELIWESLTHGRTLHILRNPRYAGAFFFGRTRTRRTVDGRTHTERLPQDEWYVLLPDTHPGYICWTEYEDNQRRLRENAKAHGQDRRQSPPREGPALLQGLVICGRCGARMTVRYHIRSGRRVPDYVCQNEYVQHSTAMCQHVAGGEIDDAIGDLLIEAVTPLALEVALGVQQELNARAEEMDQLRRQQVERVRYEADMAQRRYLRVDPDNRLVADALEADWNEKLRALKQSQDEYERQRQADRLVVDEKQRTEILALATDFPRLWRDPKTPDRERKRMVRLLLEDVTLIKRDKIMLNIRFKGGATRSLALPVPLMPWQTWQTDPLVIKKIDHLLENHTAAEAAEILNAEGLRSGKGGRFASGTIHYICSAYGLKDRFTRLREAGLLTKEELADHLGIAPRMVGEWCQRGRVQACVYNSRGERLYELPKGDWAHKRQVTACSDAQDGHRSDEGGAV